jgi:hypothetical protein
MASRIYPMFIKFTVPVREDDRFQGRLRDIAAEYGINKDLIYFSSYTQEKLHEVEYFIKIEIPTGSQKSMEQHLLFVNDVFNSPLKTYTPTYSEEPNLKRT